MSPNTNRWVPLLVVLMFIAGVILFFAPRLLVGAFALPALMVLTLVTIIVLMGVIAATQQTSQPEKRKREQKDTFAMLDELVGKLTDDELAYLRQRLQDEEQPSREDIRTTLESLLAERSNGAKHKRS